MALKGPSITTVNPNQNNNNAAQQLDRLRLFVERVTGPEYIRRQDAEQRGRWLQTSTVTPTLG